MSRALRPKEETNQFKCAVAWVRQAKASGIRHRDGSDVIARGSVRDKWDCATKARQVVAIATRSIEQGYIGGGCGQALVSFSLACEKDCELAYQTGKMRYGQSLERGRERSGHGMVGRVGKGGPGCGGTTREIEVGQQMRHVDGATAGNRCSGCRMEWDGVR